jgi:hypothetical protein
MGTDIAEDFKEGRLSHSTKLQAITVSSRRPMATLGARNESRAGASSGQQLESCAHEDPSVFVTERPRLSPGVMVESIGILTLEGLKVALPMVVKNLIAGHFG